MEHYFKKHNKGGASHQKEIEKSIESFERFLSLHKLTSSWHKERIRKGTKIGKLKFFITLELKQFCARKETKNKTSNTYCVQMSVHFIIIMIQSFLYILLSS